MSPLLQSLIVGAIVLFAASSMLRRIAPARVWRWQAKLAYVFERGAPDDSLRARFGRRLRPAVTATAAGCAVACPSCNGCR